MFMSDREMIDKWLKNNNVIKLDDDIKSRDTLKLDVNGKILGRKDTDKQAIKKLNKNCNKNC